MLNAADILILAVLALSTLLGLLRGFVSGVLSLVCWIAAFWAAWAFGGAVAGWYAGLLADPAACYVAGYLSCFLAVLVVGALAGWAVRGLLDRGGLRGGDRFLGMLFGLARGWLLVTAAVFVLGFTAIPRQAPWWRQSSLLPGFAAGADWLAQRLPPEVGGYLSAGGKALPALNPIPMQSVRPLPGQPGVATSAASRAVPPAAGTVPPATPRRHADGDVGQ